MHRGLKVKPIPGLQSIIKINIVKKAESDSVNRNTEYYTRGAKKIFKIIHSKWHFNSVQEIAEISISLT